MLCFERLKKKDKKKEIKRVNKLKELTWNLIASTHTHTHRHQNCLYCMSCIFNKQNKKPDSSKRNAEMSLSWIKSHHDNDDHQNWQKLNFFLCSLAVDLKIF